MPPNGRITWGYFASRGKITTAKVMQVFTHWCAFLILTSFDVVPVYNGDGECGLDDISSLSLFSLYDAKCAYFANKQHVKVSTITFL